MGPAINSLARTPTSGHKYKTPWTVGHPISYTRYIYSKFTQLLVIRTKLANWPNWG